MSETGESAQAPTRPPVRPRPLPSQAQNRMTLSLSASLRDRLDGHYQALIAVPRPDRPAPLHLVDSRRDLIEWACQRLFDRLCEPPGEVWVGELMLTRGRHTTSTYLQPWEDQFGEDGARLAVRLPQAQCRRLAALHDRLGPHPNDCPSVEHYCVRSVNELVVLACHLLCEDFPPLPAHACHEGRQPLFVQIPDGLHAQLVALREQLETTGAAPEHHATLHGARTLGDLVTVACRRMLRELAPPA